MIYADANTDICTRCALIACYLFIHLFISKLGMFLHNPSWNLELVSLPSTNKELQECCLFSSGEMHHEGASETLNNSDFDIWRPLVLPETILVVRKERKSKWWQEWKTEYAIVVLQLSVTWDDKNGWGWVWCSRGLL